MADPQDDDEKKETEDSKALWKSRGKSDRDAAYNAAAEAAAKRIQKSRSSKGGDSDRKLMQEAGEAAEDEEIDKSKKKRPPIYKTDVEK